MQQHEPLALDPDFLTLTRPSGADPYKVLVLVILERAVQDAQGHIAYPGYYAPDALEAEARVWLQDGVGDYLLTLAGYDPAILGSLSETTPTAEED